MQHVANIMHLIEKVQWNTKSFKDFIQCYM